jgi:hypothetical protein
MFRKIAKQFLLNEQFKIDPAASIQALADVVNTIRVTNKRDTNRLQVAKEHINAIKRHMRSLNEKVNSLEEQLRILNEDK